MPELQEKDYRDLYFDQRFKNFDDKLDTIIGYQKTASKNADVLEGRVKVIERLQLSCPIDKVVKDLAEHKIETAKSIEQLKKDTEDASFYTKRPMQARMVVIGWILLGLFALIPAVYMIINVVKH